MPENKEKEEKQGKLDKKEGGEGKLKDNFLSALFDQAITEWTRPMVEKIPLPILQTMKKVGMDKILPVLGVAFSTALSSSKIAFGDSLGDFVSELTAETRRIMNQKVSGEETSEPTKSRSAKKTQAGILNQILPGLDANEITDIFTTFAQLFSDATGKDKPEKEVKQILALIEQMDSKELYVFLKLDKTQRDFYLKIFVKRTEEKSLAESVKELKKDLRKFKAEIKMVREELLTPAWRKIEPGLNKVVETVKKVKALDDACADGTTAKQRSTSFRERAKQFNENSKR